MALAYACDEGGVGDAFARLTESDQQVLKKAEAEIGRAY